MIDTRRGVDASITSPSTDRTLRWYGRFVRRYAVLFILFAALGVVTSAIAISMSDPVYRASTQIVVSVLPTAPGQTRQVVSIDSDAQMLTSTRVLHAAAQEISYDGGAEALRDEIRVFAVPNSRVLEISVEDTNPRRALAATEAIASNFLRLRMATEANRLEASREALQTQLEEIGSRLAVVRGSVIGADEFGLFVSGEEAALMAEISSLHSDLARLAADQAQGGFVSERASLPTEGRKPWIPTVLASSVLLGVLVAAIMGWMIDGLTQLRSRRALVRRVVGETP